MSDNKDSDMSMLIELIEWAEDKEWFDISFLKSLEEATEQPWFNGFSAAQKNSIANMYAKFLG
jgi:hypothetical protein